MANAGLEFLAMNTALPMFLVRTWATSIEVFIRANFGARYLGM